MVGQLCQEGGRSSQGGLLVRASWRLAFGCHALMLRALVVESLLLCACVDPGRLESEQEGVTPSVSVRVS